MDDKTMKLLEKIAAEHIPALEERGDLKTRDSDGEDFFETAVWCLRDALVAAYELGRSDKERI